ncbi:MAG: primosomal protein N' [Solirubrobacterales bacterium]|nr:primosomal protein N' [Solirubrobacterales bacterium]MCB8914797.1 primosomal protein N' [Thermoleophilales bacterium]
MSIARVEPLTTARALRGPFDYLIPERLGEIRVGTVLEVPFGRRRITGVVVEIAATSELPPEKLAEPIRVVGTGTNPDLIDLGLWIASEYCSTPARGLGLALPPGTGTGGERTRFRVEKMNSITEAGREALDGGARLGAKQKLALQQLLEGDLNGRQLAARAGIDSTTLKRLGERGLIERRQVHVRRRPEGSGVGAAAANAPELTAAQSEAVDRLVSGLDDPGGGEGVLLNGVTGSGKTEVYLALVEEVLRRGRTAIVLVPEIGLTPQAVGRFQARLGDRVAVLHSALTAGQRFDEWQRLKAGDATVCVGPRSAVFAPLESLGLIVIDEEHDSSYKQEGDPRYDAREVARRRARETGSLLVLGTATPRPESWSRLARIELPDRVDGQSMPPVELVDMREADPRQGPIHRRTWEALAEIREKGEKAIVMINRRGFAPWLTCQTCGHHWGCPNCDVSLIVHRESDQLICHHCNHAETLPRRCPECGGTTLSQTGAGTQRIERLLAEELSPMPVFRLDADTSAGPGGHASILSAFDQEDSAILVGTQMVAKGHDFPEVTLAAILDADATLRFPDFRAEERTFSLVTQLAGRSGRSRAGGRVIVQTLAPGSPSISHAATHDSAGFLAGELDRRRELGYPPFSHLIRIQLAAEAEPDVDSAANLVAARVDDALPAGAELLGPAPMFRARNRYRRRLLIRSTTRAESIAAVHATIEELLADRSLKNITLAIDVDPQ